MSLEIILATEDEILFVLYDRLSRAFISQRGKPWHDVMRLLAIPFFSLSLHDSSHLYAYDNSRFRVTELFSRTFRWILCRPVTTSFSGYMRFYLYAPICAHARTRNSIRDDEIILTITIMTITTTPPMRFVWNVRPKEPLS